MATQPAAKPVATSPKIVHEARLGRNVLWYAQADAGLVPCVGTVVMLDGGGLVNVRVAPATGGEERTYRAVRHVSDPGFLNTPSWRASGGWEHLEGDEPDGYKHPETVKREKLEARKLAGKAVKPSVPGYENEELNKQIIKLADEGKSPDEIAKAVGHNLTAKMVEQRLEALTAKA